MGKKTVLLVAVAFGLGILSSILFLNLSNNQPELKQPIDQSAKAPVDLAEQIKTLESLVKQDPKNRQAWVQLGHRYFDTNNPIKAIEAYDQALAIDGNDPDVLTDQAIMYRELGWFDKAIETFQKANQLNPSHANSLFNMGIVYSQDLGEKEKAIDAFSRFLKLVPSGPAADRAKSIIEHLEGGHN